MANMRLTFGALLDTVTATASTVTQTVGAASTAVGMLNAYVDQAAENQRIRILIEKERSQETIIREAAQEETEDNIRIAAYCKRSPEHKASYEAAYNKYAALLAPKTELRIAAE